MHKSITEALSEIIPHGFTAFFRTSLLWSNVNEREISSDTEQRSTDSKHGAGYRNFPPRRRVRPIHHVIFQNTEFLFLCVKSENYFFFLKSEFSHI